MAMLQASIGVIPEQQFYHNPTLTNKDGVTVAMLLEANQIPVPEEWQYDPKIILDKYGNTTALKLAYYGIAPSQLWFHNQYYTNEFDATVEDYLKGKHIRIPLMWLCSYDFIKFYNIRNKMKLLSNPNYYLPSIGMSVAMFCAAKRIIPLKEFQHDPELKNKQGNTVALIFALKGSVIPKKWLHDPKIANNYGETVAMFQAYNGQIPNQYWRHDPELQSSYGFTVAMYLAKNRIVPPPEWHHISKLQNINGCTVAMYMAQNKMDIPKEWEHDPLIRSKNKNTVGLIYSENGIIPPKFWMHDINYKNKYNYSIKSSLYESNYIMKDNKFILNFKTVKKDDICSICFGDGEQTFLLTKCGHKVCIQCLQEMINAKSQQQLYLSCPICRSKDWLYNIHGQYNSFKHLLEIVLYIINRHQ